MRPRFLLLLMMLMACAAAPGRALAQSGPLAFNAQLFRPAIGPEDVITVVGTRTQGALQPMAHLLFDFGYRLVYLLQVDGSLLASPVETMTTAHLMGGVGLTRFWALSLDLPVVLYQSGGFDGPHELTSYHVVRESDGAKVDVWEEGLDDERPRLKTALPTASGVQ